MALTEEQKIAQKLGKFDPVSEWVLKPEAEKIAEVIEKHAGKDRSEKKAAFPPQQMSGGMGGGMPGGMGGGMPPQHPMMAAPGQMDPAMMAPPVDPVDAENETLEKMIKNVQLKKQLMEEHSSMAAATQGGAPGGMMGQMAPPTPQMQSDPMAHLRQAMGAR